MSRWEDQFRAHPFNTHWARILEQISQSKVDDETVVTDVKELARLIKVVRYLQVMIKGVDPELVPSSTWDNFSSQAEACANQIQTFNSNRAISHLQQANAHADNLLAYLRPYMVGDVVAGNAQRSSLDGYFQTFNQYVESFKEKATGLLVELGDDKKKGHGLYKAINNFKVDLDQLKIELFDPENGAQSKINKLVATAESQNSKILEVYKEVVVGGDDKLSTKVAVHQAYEQIESEKEDVIAIVETVENEVADIRKFHAKVFGGKNENGVVSGGISSAFEGLMKKLTEFEQLQKNRYLALNKEIEDLLPGATSAGLATAYKEMKESFSRSILIASTTFYISLLLLFISAISSAVDSFLIWPFSVTFAHVGEWDAILKGVAHRIPLYIPVLWLALYASKRRSEFQRLQQEYAHKEALAKSYNNFKKQIDDLGEQDKALLNKLLDKAIDAISYNASETLDKKHDEKLPAQQILDMVLEGINKLRP